MLGSITYNTNKTSPEIHVCCKFDNIVLDDSSFQKGKKQIRFEILDTPDIEFRKLTVELKGKQDYHTLLDQENNIIDDYYTIIESVILDEIDVTDQFASGQRCYTHNNGFTDKFFGFLGVNGVVCFEFYTPLWKWFLSRCI